MGFFLQCGGSRGSSAVLSDLQLPYLPNVSTPPEQQKQSTSLPYTFSRTTRQNNTNPALASRATDKVIQKRRVRLGGNGEKPRCLSHIFWKSTSGLLTKPVSHCCSFMLAFSTSLVFLSLGLPSPSFYFALYLSITLSLSLFLSLSLAFQVCLFSIIPS